MIVVITTIISDENKIDFIKNELCKLVPLTQKEYGCIGYSFYQDSKQSNYFNSYEIWLNQECLEKHLETYYIKNYLKNTQKYVDTFVIRQMNKIC